jgi:diacylglycerol kinase (ATP)
MRKNIVLIGNPIAGGGALDKIHSAESVLRERGFNVNVMLTSRRGDAESFARQAASMPDSLVIAAGGDGTYNEAANGLAGSETPLAILPLGTTSVLARELGIPLDHEKALDIAVNGRTQTVSIGKIAYTTTRKNIGDEQDFSRFFLLMTGIGIDADAVYGVNEKLKKFSGRVAYILSGIKEIAGFRPEGFEMEAAIKDHNDIEGGNFRVNPDYVTLTETGLRASGYIAVVSKAACYGGDFVITPDAKMQEPFLYAFILHKKGRPALIRLLIAIISGKPLALKDISYFRTDELIINGTGRMQIDGDYAGRAPAKIGLAKNSLKLVIPA